MQSTVSPEQCGVRLKLPLSVSTNTGSLSRRVVSQELKLQAYDVSRGYFVKILGEQVEIWPQHCRGITCLQCYITGMKPCAPRWRVDL